MAPSVDKMDVHFHHFCCKLTAHKTNWTWYKIMNGAASKNRLHLKGQGSPKNNPKTRIFISRFFRIAYEHCLRGNHFEFMLLPQTMKKHEDFLCCCRNRPMYKSVRWKASNWNSSTFQISTKPCCLQASFSRPKCQWVEMKILFSAVSITNH